MRGGGLRLLADCVVYDKDDVLSSMARFGQFRFERTELDPGLMRSLSSRSISVWSKARYSSIIPSEKTIQSASSPSADEPEALVLGDAL